MVDSGGLSPHSSVPTMATNSAPKMDITFILSGGRRLVKELHINLNMQEVAAVLATDLSCQPEDLEIYSGTEPVPDSLVLAGLDLERDGFVLHVLERLIGRRRSPARRSSSGERRGRPPAHIVVHTGSGRRRRALTVSVEPCTQRKPFLGGYRDVRDDTEYWHASAQTYATPYLQYQHDTVRQERDAQTAWARVAAVQTPQDACSQTARPGIWRDGHRDTLLAYSGRYCSAQELEQHRLAQIILLQRYWRRWLARRRVARMRETRNVIMEWMVSDAERRRQAKLKRRAGVLERKMDPKSKNDFDILYNAVEKWRQKAVAYCYATKAGGELRAALCQLLERQAQMLRAVGGHLCRAGADARAHSRAQLLQQTQEPLRWLTARGPVLVDTAETLWARQLRDLHTALTLPTLTAAERADLLTTLVTLIASLPFSADNHELRELCKREIDLLARGVAPARLAGLRRRTLQTLWRLVRHPDFNPAAAKHQKVAAEPEQIRGDVNTCLSCQRRLPRAAFQVNAADVALGRCRSCDQLDNWARRRLDNNVLSKMLAELRRDEQHRSPQSVAVCIIQDADFRHIVLVLWGGQSCLSADPDLYELLCCRWDVAEPWTPWNCALLTRDEAEAHYKLGHPLQYYGPELCGRVRLRHLAAARYFCQLPAMMRRLQLAAAGGGGGDRCLPPPPPPPPPQPATLQPASTPSDLAVPPCGDL